jgi:hypothetical protein
MWRCNIVNKELIGIAIICLVFSGIGAVAAESNLYAFTLRADRVLTDYIGGNATSDKVNITGLVIQAGQILGYYNKSATDTLLGAKANDSDLTAHTGDTNNPHNVTTAQTGAAEATHNHTGDDITSQVSDAHTVDGSHASAFMSSSVEIRFTEWDGFTLGVEFVATGAGIAIIEATLGNTDTIYITIDKDNGGSDVETYKGRHGGATAGGTFDFTVTVPFDKGDGVTISQSGATGVSSRVYYFGIS